MPTLRSHRAPWTTEQSMNKIWDTPGYTPLQKSDEKKKYIVLVLKEFSHVPIALSMINVAFKPSYHIAAFVVFQNIVCIKFFLTLGGDPGKVEHLRGTPILDCDVRNRIRPPWLVDQSQSHDSETEKAPTSLLNGFTRFSKMIPDFFFYNRNTCTPAEVLELQKTPSQVAAPGIEPVTYWTHSLSYNLT
ncbi:hypothetical protein GQR58_026884 [Nymphon striatum]|nr:hypothetical protein GQR58_026884 [Nymphon striatum]